MARPVPAGPQGAPNKISTMIKDAALKAAEIAGGGGPDGLVNYLVIQAEKNPGPFLALLGKVLPMQVSGEGGGNIIVEIVKHGRSADLDEDLSGPL